MRLLRAMDLLPRRHALQAQGLYLWALLKRFRFTFIMLVVVVLGGGTLLYVLNRYRGLVIIDVADPDHPRIRGQRCLDLALVVNLDQRGQAAASRYAQQLAEARRV